MCLTRDERNLLATAYECKLAALRAAYRTTRQAADEQARELARKDPRTKEAAEQGSIVRLVFVVSPVAVLAVHHACRRSAHRGWVGGR